MRFVSALAAIAFVLAPSAACATPLCDALEQIIAASDTRFNEIVAEDGQTGRLIPPGFDRCTKMPERFGRIEYRCRSAAADESAGRAARRQADAELARCPNTVAVELAGQPLTLFRRGDREIRVWLAGGGADGLGLTVFAGNLRPGE